MSVSFSINGININPEVIESVLCNHPSVADAILVPDKGRYTERLVAWIIRDPESEIDIFKIRQYSEKLLPLYMIPSVIIFTKQFPLAANGEINRAVLSFDLSDLPKNTDHELPRNLLENVISEIWKSILGLEHIGLYDDFLDLGGDSIQAGIISLKIQEYFNVIIPLILFYEDMTVRSLTTYIEDQILNNSYVPSDIIYSIDRNDDMPLSFFQEARLRYELNLDVFNIPYLHSSSWFSIKLSGVLDRKALDNAFTYVINRHEVFRTAYWPVFGTVSPAVNKWDTICQLCRINPELFLPKVKFKQFIHPSVTLDFTYHNLADLNDEVKYFDLSIISNDIIQKRYIYEFPPLTRVALIQISETEHILIVVAANLITDGVSMHIYERELAYAYSAFVNNQPINLPDIRIHYADYAAWMKQRHDSGAFDLVKSYWQNQYEGYIPTDITILPFTDIAGSETDNDFGIEAKYYYHSFSEELSESIRKYAGSVNITKFSIAMAGFILCLYAESGNDDIGVFTFFSNRTRLETENIIGKFATGNIIRVNIKKNDSIKQFVTNVSESLIGALKNQEFIVSPPDFRTNKSLYDFVVNRPITCEMLTDFECSTFSGLSTEKIFLGRNKSEFALRSFVIDSGFKLAFMFQYNLDLFDRVDIRRIAIRTENIINNIISNPTNKISSITC